MSETTCTYVDTVRMYIVTHILTDRSPYQCTSIHGHDQSLSIFVHRLEEEDVFLSLYYIIQ